MSYFLYTMVKSLCLVCDWNPRKIEMFGKEFIFAYKYGTDVYIKWTLPMLKMHFNKCNT